MKQNATTSQRNVFIQDIKMIEHIWYNSWLMVLNDKWQELAHAIYFLIRYISQLSFGIEDLAVAIQYKTVRCGLHS